MKKLMVVAMAIAAAASASCAEYRIKDGASDWTDPKNYEPEGTPGASDVILVMDETTVYLSDSDAASVAVVNGVSKVAPWGRNATLEITVAGELTITVSDNGAGISADQLEKIRNYIYHPSDDRSVGLQNVYKRLQIYYGGQAEFSVESAEGQGTRVKIRVPVEE